jgi:hypothetical protein
MTHPTDTEIATLLRELADVVNLHVDRHDPDAATEQMARAMAERLEGKA